VTPSNFTFPSPGIESGDLLRYGGTAPAIPNAVFFDGSQTQSLIGNAGVFATNLWFSNGTAASRPQEIACAFEYNATGGGTFNNDADFGAALFAASKLSGGSRSIFAINGVCEVDITGTSPSFGRQASVVAIEADLNNNSSADCALSTEAYDQMVAVRAVSGGIFKPQVAFQTFATSAANRFQVGASLANWSSFGLVIVQDPGTFTPDASGINIGHPGAPCTGPAILLQPSSDANFPMIKMVNAENSAVPFQLLQNGIAQWLNNTALQWTGSDGVYRDVLAYTGTNTFFFSGQDAGQLVDQSLGVHFTWSSVGIGFNGFGPVAQPVGYGTPTGGSHQASFSASTITLPNLAAAVAQLIVDLKGTGLIAA
jgi:hypothetical protein